MNTNATALYERCNTLTIFIWFFTLMWMHMDNKISVYWKRFTTQNTLLWVFTSMYTQMFCKITVQNEILITLSAFTRFFSSMQIQMFYEVTVLYEILLTKSAFIRFFSNICMVFMSALILCEKVTQWLLWYSICLVSVNMICMITFSEKRLSQWLDWQDLFVFVLYTCISFVIKVMRTVCWKLVITQSSFIVFINCVCL